MSEKPENMWGDTVALIRDIGVWELGRHGPCDCAHFQVQTIEVHVSCQRSGRSIEVTCAGDPTAVNDAMLKAVAAEVRRQLAARTSVEWAQTFTVTPS